MEKKILDKVTEPKSTPGGQLYSETKISFPFPIRLICKISDAWEIFISFTIFYLVLSVSYTIFFSLYVEETWIIAEILDAIFTIDVLLQLSVEIWRCQKNIPYRIFHVEYTAGQFLVDSFSLIPLEEVFLQCVDEVDSLYNLGIVDYCQLNKILRFSRTIKYLRQRQAEHRLNEAKTFLFYYGIMYIMCAHLFACTLHWFCSETYISWILHKTQSIDSIVNGTTEVDSCFLRLRNIKKIPEHPDPFPEPLDIYVTTLYFVVTILTTVGYGDLYATTIAESLLFIFLMVLGAIWITGDLSNSLMEFELEPDILRNEVFKRREGINKYLVDNDNSSFIIEKIQDYYRYLWTYHEGVTQTNFPMREEIMYDICREMFHKAPLFRDLEEPFLQDVAGLLEARLYNPNIILCQAGDYAMEMYYILHGECNVLHRVRNENAACILRPGCIIGEINMFFSIPHGHTIETRTVCQILTLHKKDLMTLLDGSPYMYALMRERVERRRQKMRRTFTVVGNHPNVYACKRKNVEITGDEHLDYDYNIVLRKATGLNRVVQRDIVMDETSTYIVDMPCTNNKLRKTNKGNYSELIAAPILIENRSVLIKVWVHMFVLYLLFVSLNVPYCVAFSSDLDKNNICHFWLGWYMILFNFIDVIVEIIGAVPVTGIYYQLVDGFRTQRCQCSFYLDVMSFIPFEYLYVFPILDKVVFFVTGLTTDFSDPWFPVTIRSLCKMWKILRYFHYLDNKFYNGVVFIRISKLFVVLPICTHWIACLLFWIACPNRWGRKCKSINWMNIDFLRNGSDTSANLVSNVNQYVLSYYFAAVTLTSVGFGDFTPQSSYEMLWIIVIMIFGVFVVMYLMAGITSALTARIRPQLHFNQKFTAIKYFMRQYGLGEPIQERVLEHYKLQHQLRYEVALPGDVPINHLMYDAPKYLLDDAVYTEFLPYLEGVTIFSRSNPEIIIKAGKLLKRYLLPPSITFMDAGEVRREMYIVFKGSIALYRHPNDEIPISILEETGYHGIRDLLYGEPCQYAIKTVGHVVLLAINYKMVHDLFADEKFFMDFMAQSCQGEKDIVTILSDQKYIKKFRGKEMPSTHTAWVEYPKDEWDYTGSTFHTTKKEFEEPFRRTKYGGLMKLFMLPFTIHPAGTFATFWVSLQCINCLLLLSTLLLESIMDYRPPGLRMIQIFIDIINALDLYVKLHWAYYDVDGTLYYHPIKTLLKSVYHGNFFFDLCLLCPAELIVYMYGTTDIYGYGEGYRWYSLLRWGRFFRFYKLIEPCYIMYNTFDHRLTILLILYGIVYLGFTTLLAMIAVNTACPPLILDWTEGDEYKLSACSLNSWITLKEEAYKHLKLEDPNFVGLQATTLSERLLLGVYYVGEVILVIGYGEIFTTRSEELPFVLILVILGSSAYQLIIADLSASMIDSDEDRHIFREQRNRLLTILNHQNVPKKLYKSVRRHFQHTWAVSKGINPIELFKNLHPILEGDLFQELNGEIFQGIPLFQGFGRNCLRALCKFMSQESFYAGQRMTRFGNMEYQLYIIVDGEVHITDRHLRWKCTLTSGEMFGELSLIYGTPRHYSAFAANNVEAYVISADNFANFLQLYPQLKDSITSVLTEKGIEYYEIKYRAKQLENYEKYCKDREILTEQIRRNVSENEDRLVIEGDKAYYHEVKKPFSVISNIIGFGGEDSSPSRFLYFTGRYMIHPKCQCMRIFRRLVIAIRLMSPILESYKVFFFTKDVDDEVTADVVYLSYIFECVFCMHMILTFFTALELERGLYCVQYSRIVANYLLAPQLFLLDFISSLPVEIIGGSNTYWLVLRFLRLPQYFHSLWMASHDLEVSNFRFKLSISGSAFFLISHLLACAFYAAACPTANINECTHDGWVKQAINAQVEHNGRIINEPPSKWYIHSFYWVITTLTTTGFGDITSNTYEEIEITLICMMFCAFGMCILIGNLTTGLQSWYKARREFFYQANIFVRHLKGMGLSKDYQQLLMTFYIIKWHNARGVSYSDAISVLPLTTQFEVCTCIYFKCVSQCKFFGLAKETSLMRNICARIKHHIFLPGNIIKRQGNVDGNLYVVFKGHVTSYRIDKLTGERIFLKKYAPNFAFGKVPALFRNVSYNKTYRAEGYVELLSIHQSDIKHIAKNYPRWKRYLKMLILKRYPNLTAEPFISNIFEHRKERQLQPE